MTGPFREMAGLDRLIHEPARLSITTALEACERANFLFLQRLTGLSKGNLSSHLSKLQAAGLVQIDKSLEGGTSTTTVRLTPPGRQAVRKHWQRLDGLRQAATRWQPDTSD
jgi:DNA-binding MarR family transcriptional regulator